MFDNSRTVKLWHHKCVRDLPTPDLGDVDITHVLHALSDPVRLEIVRLLSAGPELHCALIAETIGADLQKSTLSHHYGTLREAGLTRARYEGSRKYLSLRAGEVDARFPGLLAAVLATAPAARA